MNTVRSIQLGDKVKDLVTGFVGIVVARTEWLNKCVRFSVQSQKLEAGKIPEAQWIDEDQLELVQAQAITTRKQKFTGGPRPVEGLRAIDPKF